MTKSTSPSPEELKQKAKSVSEDVSASARQTAQDAASTVRDEAARRADDTKMGVAAEVSDVASALRKAADDMRSGSPQERTFGQIAGGLADVSDQIRGKDLGEVANELSTFAKRNPMLFLGGIALAGFAATRFATASARRTETADDSDTHHDVVTASSVHSGRTATRAQTTRAQAGYTPAAPKTTGGVS